MLGLAAVLALTSPVALAEDGEEEASEGLCEDGPRNKDWMLSLGATVLGTIAVSAVGLNTLSRSLASGGYRQGASNMAGMGLGAFVGGCAGAGVMAFGDCGVATVPGFIGVAVAGIGLLVAMFAIVTGRR